MFCFPVTIRVDASEDLTDQLSEFCDVVFSFYKFNPYYRLTILIDEFQEYVGSRASKKQNKIRAMFVQGLAKNIRMVFTSQGWSMVEKNFRNNCERTIILNQRKQDIDSMMDLGLVPYDKDKNGNRICLLKFNRKYQAYMEDGIGGKFGVIQ